ncbi:hypothetical protein MBT84_29520 [Streptomyces sp. MBT84]|uniref:hypothetical protein n=1 Tax=unclassified Streptomyces TaxID=2593676 RepID=UPI000E39A8CB|nr:MULTISPECIES: hypothetical protein [unclassified Streptomyces]MBW8703741.1 hypothetical protein [Streptomyces sp. MBT84]REE60446.1 hypothetical protein BX257_2980 [Streptomyces sp. 3212.3]
MTLPRPIGPAGRLARWLRFFPRSVADGLAALRDLLLWGHVYPRTVTLETLRRMKGQR